MRLPGDQLVCVHCVTNQTTYANIIIKRILSYSRYPFWLLQIQELTCNKIHNKAMVYRVMQVQYSETINTSCALQEAVRVWFINITRINSLKYCSFILILSKLFILFKWQVFCLMICEYDRELSPIESTNFYSLSYQGPKPFSESWHFVTYCFSINPQ